MKKAFPLKKVHTLLESGPVILVATAAGGKNNVMPMSWHTMIDFDPPLVGCVISDESLTYSNLLASRECTINVPTLSIARKALACGGVSGREADKFGRFGLTPEPGRAVRAPLVKECWAALECRLHDARLAKKYNLFIFKVVKAWADPAVKQPKTFHHRGGPEFIVAGRPVRLK